MPAKTNRKSQIANRKKKALSVKKRPLSIKKGSGANPARIALPVPLKEGAKKIIKKPSLKKAVKKKAVKPAQPQVKGTLIGKVSHYFPHVNAAVIKLKSPLKIGDTIRIKGHTSDLKEVVGSMQINRLPINEAKKGDEIGLLVTSRVRAGDTIYKI